MGKELPEHESVIGLIMVLRETNIFVHVKCHDIAEAGAKICQLLI